MSSTGQDRDSRHSSPDYQRVGSFSSASPALAPSVSTSLSSPLPAPDSDSNSNTGATFEKPVPGPDRSGEEQGGVGERVSWIEGRTDNGREEEDEEHNVVAGEIRKVIALVEGHGCVTTGKEEPLLSSAETENSSLSWQDVDEHTWRGIQADTCLNRTRWDYYPARRRLRIRMPSAVHDEFIQTVGSHISEQLRNALRTRPEPAVSARTLHLPGSTTIRFSNRSERSPDFSLSVSDSATTFPSIVFEKDFSSGGDDRDCLNFIKRSSGHIRTVVTFCTQYHGPADRLSSAATLSPPTINLYRLVPIPGREGVYRPRKVVDNVALQHGRTLDFQLSDLLHLGSMPDTSIPIYHSFMLNTWNRVVGLQHRIDSEKQNSYGKRPRNEEFTLECSSSDSDGDNAAYKPPKQVLRPSKRNKLHD